MKRIIDSTLVILSLMLIFGCKESKVGQGNPTKDSMSIDTDSVISGKVFTKQDIASEDTLNAVIRTQSPKSKDFDFEVFIMRGEKTVQIIPQFGITECLIQYKCSENTPPPYAIRSG